MTTTIGVRDISRNMTSLQDYDYVNIEDKKTKEYKGLLVSSKYADEIRKYLDKKVLAERQKELDKIMQFAGILDGETKDMTIQELKASKVARYTIDDGKRTDK